MGKVGQGHNGRSQGHSAPLQLPFQQKADWELPHPPSSCASKAKRHLVSPFSIVGACYGMLCPVHPCGLVNDISSSLPMR